MGRGRALVLGAPADLIRPRAHSARPDCVLGRAVLSLAHLRARFATAPQQQRNRHHGKDFWPSTLV